MHFWHHNLECHKYANDKFFLVSEHQPRTDVPVLIPAEQTDSLFSFGGLDALRDPECVPDSYHLPTRVSNIADECVRLVEEGFDDLERLNGELAVRKCSSTAK